MIGIIFLTALAVFGGYVIYCGYCDSGLSFGGFLLEEVLGQAVVSIIGILFLLACLSGWLQYL